ncbi:uncharacterized protein LOC115629136 [Scaptodrosophila lebanonensis]|uniref:Uncharacterized protein LOC115629136 n=1 Tax=Drosophila lebanonensis TaxID=7225 RepID=A0A6J2U0B3_DROLE|nr:uncharacterized protein LOC115629136 [Scaptodrosophila lebanonensis]XP_030381341.1 uncharacterized protein LOC115629136 [Scaptodrosophila lebanonensis]
MHQQLSIKRKPAQHHYYQLLLVLLLLQLGHESASHTDWMQTCGNCHCQWNSGKKNADCKNKGFIKIPMDLSNELQVVDFSHNQIPELRREEFLSAQLQHLHKIYLRNCTIQEISRDALKGLQILIELDISNNRIRELHPKTFAGLEKLRNVIVNNNEIEVLQDYLFEDLPYLSRIEFKSNRLKQVQMHVFSGQMPVSVISLEDNLLTHLHKRTFEDLKKLMNLSLQGNMWNCSCDLQEFRDYTFTRRLYTPPTNCHDPPYLRGKMWMDVPSENFACRPRILGSVRSFVEANHDNLTLPCRIVGTPRPNVTWMFNNRPLNLNDQRVRVFTSVEQMPNLSQSSQVITSELHIFGIRTSDKGAYICVADNRGGKAEAEFQLLVNDDYTAPAAAPDGLGGLSISGASNDSQTNLLLIICLIATTLLLLLIVTVLTLFWYCRRIKTYKKNSVIIADELISPKPDKTHNSSMLEGSVIMEMQKSLLNEINPVEKPPRRTDIESVDGGDDTQEIKKTLLDETVFANHMRDDETHSVAFSDTTMPHSRQTYVDETYGSLPPDLLAFPARVLPTSPSIQSSHSNIPDQVIYGLRSPTLTSPVYAHITQHGIYGTTVAATTHNGFMTLQHPKSRNLALLPTASNRQQPQMPSVLQQQQTSPFVPAPVVYSPAAAVVMKQGYMTIPRKPRVPSWTPSTSVAAAHNGTQLSEFQSLISPNPSESDAGVSMELQAEPVYDNLGLRTTASGNSTLNLHKVMRQQQQYNMRDRPLPATPSLTSVTSTAPANKIYEPIHELIQQQKQQQQQRLAQGQQQQGYGSNSETDPLYKKTRYHDITILPGVEISGVMPPTGMPALAISPASSSHTALNSPKISKTPPRPPPKPKKKISVMTRNGQGSTSQLFDDEGEDGTEV